MSFAIITSRALVASITVILFLGAPAAAQIWDTAVDHPGDDRYVLPAYPVAFVAAQINEAPSGSGIAGSYHIGTDVLSANNPDKGHHLWILLPTGNVEKLFPLPEHQGLAGLIDTPIGQLDKGSVVEPNISEDGTRLYFSYFHDTTFESNFSFGLNRLPLKGADLYVIELSELIDDPGKDPADLTVRRLTVRQYDGSGKQSADDKNLNAMNPTQASVGVNDWGTVYMHAVEMRTATGLKLVYVSDERRVMNSNVSMSIGYANHNFNLHMADIEADGSLSNTRQFQYYTTTSALSPTPLRNGIAFSYQASTEAARNWQIQGINSAGRWYPILGYGINPELFHLGTFCVKTTGATPGDTFVGTRYYNANNEGFGALWAQDLALAGVNTYDLGTYWGILPQQVGSYRVTNGVNSNDYPSAKNGGQYVGKMTTPRCGVLDELYMAYSPTSANGRLTDDEGNKSIYHSYIAYRPNLEPFHPHEAIDIANERGLQIVVDDISDTYTLVWPVPVLSWQERYGEPRQRFKRSIIDGGTTVEPGLPFAQIGTSALYNTDRKPFDCWLGYNGQTPYSPNKANTNINQENDLIVNNTDGLRYVQNQSDFCEPLDPSTVLGVAVNLTSNKTNMSAGFKPGYVTDGSGKKEAAALLGVYDVRQQADQSFMALIPAHAPIELHLLDRRYGMKLTDVRSWHSLQPRETRNDCGGCHNHEPGAAIPFAGKIADQQPPLDMVGGTPFVRYDRSCQPIMRTRTSPSRRIPEWKANIYPGFEWACGSCHNSGRSSDPAALAALSYADETSAYNLLRSRNYADSTLGALGSPAFWAARGERTDGRNNNLPKYQPNYAAGIWGYRFSAIHSTNPGLCSQDDARVANWVYRFGQWIDHHMPRDTGDPGNFHTDWYHPSVNIGLTSSRCSINELRVGFWDDTGHLASVRVSINGTDVASYTGIDNGSLTLPLTSVLLTDTVRVEARDDTDNRQMYEKSLGELYTECIADPSRINPNPKVRLLKEKSAAKRIAAAPQSRRATR